VFAGVQHTALAPGKPNYTPGLNTQQSPSQTHGALPDTQYTVPIQPRHHSLPRVDSDDPLEPDLQASLPTPLGRCITPVSVNTTLSEQFTSPHTRHSPVAVNNASRIPIAVTGSATTAYNSVTSERTSADTTLDTSASNCTSRCPITGWRLSGTVFDTRCPDSTRSIASIDSVLHKAA